MKTLLKNVIPCMVKLHPFEICCESLREAMPKKKKEISCFAQNLEKCPPLCEVVPNLNLQMSYFFLFWELAYFCDLLILSQIHIILILHILQQFWNWVSAWSSWIVICVSVCLCYLLSVFNECRSLAFDAKGIVLAFALISGCLQLGSM